MCVSRYLCAGKMRLRAAALLAAATGAHAGIGYSTLRLNPCSQAPAFLPYQVWSYNASTRSLDLADGFIFNRPRAPVDALGPAVAGASLWTSPGTGMTWTLATDGSVTPLAAAGSANGLCAALVADAQPGVGVWLQSCVPNAPEQSFKVVAPGGAIVHAASGLCLDAGSAVPPCQPGGAGAGLPFCNVSMPMDARVADLVARLTPLEKASMLDSTGGGSGRLGVAGYQVRGRGMGMVCCAGWLPLFLRSCSPPVSPHTAPARAVVARSPAHGRKQRWRRFCEPDTVRDVVPHGDHVVHGLQHDAVARHRHRHRHRGARVCQRGPHGRPDVLGADDQSGARPAVGPHSGGAARAEDAALRATASRGEPHGAHAVPLAPRAASASRSPQTPGEDPLVTAQYTVNFVKGMQEGEDPRYLRVVATCKHFAAYSLESWNGTTRDYFDAQVTDADLVEYYLTPFQACIQEARAAGIMCR